MPPTFWGRAARVSAPVFGLPVSGPLNNGPVCLGDAQSRCRRPRVRSSAGPPSRARWMVWRPQARLQEPRSGPAGRGQYAVRSAVSAGGRFPPLARPGSRAGVAPEGHRHS
ncbi:hypothetical protein NDU88_005037 [Pleurodeles waltl]|uniref:Uncharacterized protein n=1 Tax=Pleurodeles waltl TaxID=8319 RepID=A0AAV7NLB6_PLEWA|nr:hypothetical protein NDU88_005037 [Pleurodeles waltl]